MEISPFDYIFACKEDFQVCFVSVIVRGAISLSTTHYHIRQCHTRHTASSGSLGWLSDFPFKGKSCLSHHVFLSHLGGRNKILMNEPLWMRFPKHHQSILYIRIIIPMMEICQETFPMNSKGRSQYSWHCSCEYLGPSIPNLSVKCA